MTDPSLPTDPPDDAAIGALFDRLATLRTEVEQQIARRIIGQRAVIEAMLVALFARGHALFVGVPGLAKTLLVATTAESLGLASGRIQFTPDLMPGDITGTEVLEEDKATGQRHLRFVPGPIFTNLLLADEINRTPPRTQAALLQAMQEGQITAGGRTMPLDPPFQVFATQNPIEQEGTYPLPEAQLDRFMMAIDVGYPSEAEEVEMVRRTSQWDGLPVVEAVVPRDTLLAVQRLVRSHMTCSDDLFDQAVRLARATRPDGAGLDRVRRYVQWGAGPRASQHLVLAAKARAALEGRLAPDVRDLRAVAPAVLRHRVLLNFAAEAEGVGQAAVVRGVIDEILPGG